MIQYVEDYYSAGDSLHRDKTVILLKVLKGTQTTFWVQNSILFSWGVKHIDHSADTKQMRMDRKSKKKKGLNLKSVYTWSSMYNIMRQLKVWFTWQYKHTNGFFIKYSTYMHNRGDAHLGLWYLTFDRASSAGVWGALIYSGHKVISRDQEACFLLQTINGINREENHPLML